MKIIYSFLCIFFSSIAPSLSKRRMEIQQSQNGQKIKYSSGLSHLLIPYRWMGIIHFDNYGKIDKILVLYSIFTVIFQTTVISLGSYQHIENYKFYSLDKVSRIPFFIEFVAHILHFLVSTILFLRNSQFLIMMFSRTEIVRRKLPDCSAELKNVAITIRLLSFIVLLLILASASLYVANFPNDPKKLILLVGYFLTFSTYMKEETLLMYIMYLRVMLQVTNKKLRTCVVTAESVKEFRCIHNELSLLTESVSEQFEPLVTTLVAVTGLQTWGGCFSLIRTLMSERGDLYWMWCYICHITHQFLKLWFICYNCEIVQQQVRKWLY